MDTPRISIIASIGKNRELGKDGKLVWRISDDLKRVKELTTGHPIIMGRKTFDSIGHPLPNRTNIVVTRSQMCIDGCLVFDSLEKALTAAKEIDSEEVFIFGGGQLYAQGINMTDRLYLTVIQESDPGADTFFPDYSAFTKIIEQEDRAQDDLQYEWITLERSA